MNLKLSINIYICLQANQYVHWVNEWRWKINYICWTLIIAFHTINNPENVFILFIFRVCTFWKGEKRWNTAYAALYLLYDVSVLWMFYFSQYASTTLFKNISFFILASSYWYILLYRGSILSCHAHILSFHACVLLDRAFYSMIPFVRFTSAIVYLVSNKYACTEYNEKNDTHT